MFFSFSQNKIFSDFWMDVAFEFRLHLSKSADLFPKNFVPQRSNFFHYLQKFYQLYSGDPCKKLFPSRQQPEIYHIIVIIYCDRFRSFPRIFQATFFLFPFRNRYIKTEKGSTWFLVMPLTVTKGASRYEKRFSIEKCFQDQKSSGFNIEKSKIRKEELISAFSGSDTKFVETVSRKLSQS